MLTGHEIIKQVSLGNITIEPPIVNYVNANSYDVRLDGAFYVPNDEWPDDYVIDLGREGVVSRMWREHTTSGAHILINPGETILGQTVEVVGTKYPYVAKMYARSTVARMGLSVCKCAGLGDIGYVGKWTMEITNHNLNAVLLPIGARVAQFAFFRVEGDYAEYTGQYQGGIALPHALKDES